jgi:regulator of sirC expression with transglutaminase-like and TPR domain
MISLVAAGPIVYVELEKMSSESEVDQNNNQLKKLASRLKLKILKEREFNTLCKRLAEMVDWPFHGANEEYIKLTELINRYTIINK